MLEPGVAERAEGGRDSLHYKSHHPERTRGLSVKFGGPVLEHGDDSPLKFDASHNDKRYQVYKEEVLASHMMKTLTQKYGTRGKSAKFIFLQAFEEELRSGVGLKKPVAKIGTGCGPADVVEVTEAELDIDGGEDDGLPRQKDPVLTQRELASKAGNINFSLGEMMSRPSAMVTQSAFVHRLEDQVKREITRTGCPSPVYEMSWLYEEIRRESLKMGGGGTGIDDSIYETFSVRDSLEEPEEKMIARLKIFKRAFSAIILHFEALRPILRDIKRNYDAMLSLRDRQLRESLGVKKNVQHFEQALERKMAAVRFEGFKQLTEMEKQCFLLMRHVDKQDGAIRTMTDILNRLETSLSEEHDLRKDSEDQRKLLIIEINEVRRKLGMSPRPQGGATIISEEDEFTQEEDVITKDDPMILRFALETTRKNLSDAMHRLLVLEADYADVIPRHEYENLKVEMDELQEMNKATNDTFESLNSQVQGLQDQIEALTADCTKAQDTVKDLRTKATPRPSWEKIADHIDGGLPRWEAIYTGKPTSEIVSRMAEELSGRRVSGPPEYLTPLGLLPTVPRYLRYDSRIRARRFARRDVLIVIQDIYQTRIDQLESLRRWNEAKDEESGSYGGASSMLGVPDEKPNIVAFPDFVADYFEARYHLIALRMEWTYNLLEACKQYGGIDPRLVQFQSMLTGKVDETVYHLFRSQVALLRDALVKKSEDVNMNPGSLQVSQFRKVLQQTFPEKTEDEIVRLLRAASKQSGVYADYSIMKYIVFFVMTEEGLIGEFIDELSKQFHEDRMQYVYEILGQLLSELGVSLSSAEREDDPAGDTDVTMPQMFNAIVVVDPTITDEKLGSAMAWIFVGASSLPGMPPKGQYLVEYLKNKLRRAEIDEGGEEDDENDDDDFERSLRDVREDTDEDLSAKQRKAQVKKLRVTNLRTVVRRLKGGAFLRHGRRYPASDLSPPGTSGDLDLPQIQAEGESMGVAGDEGRKGSQGSSAAPKGLSGSGPAAAAEETKETSSNAAPAAAATKSAAPKKKSGTKSKKEKSKKKKK